MRFAILAAAALAALPAVAQETHTHETGHDSHLAELHGLHVLHAWTAATGADTTLVYMDIENTGAQDVVLEGAECALAETVALVGFTLKDGAAQYQDLPPFPIKAGGEVVLAPNGLALRLTGLSAPLEEGEGFELELQTSLGHLDVDVQVEPKGATAHSHAGHSH
ncbi:copper chaperone PCu(A)C [Actibacterium sp. D379-3]